MATTIEAKRGWRSALPAGLRPYTESAPIAAFFLGVSSGFPYAMIGATLTTRLKQDGIDKSTIKVLASSASQNSKTCDSLDAFRTICPKRVAAPSTRDRTARSAERSTTVMLLR